MRFLLDFPWTAASLTSPDPVPSEILRRFEQLTRRHSASAVPFFAQTDAEAFFTNRHMCRAGDAAPIMRALQHLVRKEPDACQAEVVNGPPVLPPPWRAALYDDVVRIHDWRVPQIIVATERMSMWPIRDLVRVRCPPCERNSAIEEECVLASLDAYASHPCALGDYDPWDVRATEPANSGRGDNATLPRPPECRGPLTLLTVQLDEARVAGSRSHDRYWYIPTSTWSPDDPTRESWRQGRAFPRESSPERRGKLGFTDHKGDVWVWHPEECHWDVQHGKKVYTSVRPNGTIIPKR